MTESVTLPQYTLGSGGIEPERLRRQADDLRPRSEEPFARLGVQPGWNTLDLDRAARAHIEAPGTVMLPMLYFTTWGRKPG
jgi:hypothetical protein